MPIMPYTWAKVSAQNPEIYTYTVADSEDARESKRSGISTDTVAQLCTHEEDEDSGDSEHLETLPRF
jgi:hypothetical protein